MNKKADQPKGPDSQEQELPKIGKEKLQEILAQHKKWVESEGKEGARADLRRAKLQGAELGKANLQGAGLLGADLQGADLGEAKLQKATLNRAKLQKAKLSRANLQGAGGLLDFQVREAVDWDKAFYSAHFLDMLGLPLDHNQMLCIQLENLAPLWCRDFVDQP